MAEWSTQQFAKLYNLRVAGVRIPFLPQIKKQGCGQVRVLGSEIATERARQDVQPVIKEKENVGESSGRAGSNP